jgi:diguanylate cyclase (GGDEF)-like protein
LYRQCPTNLATIIFVISKSKKTIAFIVYTLKLTLRGLYLPHCRDKYINHSSINLVITPTKENKNLVNVDELKRLQLLQGLDQDSLEQLLKKSSLLEATPGKTIIAYGEINKYFYLLLTGRLCVYLDEEGISQTIIEAGENVGEMSIIDNHPTSARVVAETHCRLLVISEATMWQLVKESHAVCLNLLNSLSSRLRASDNRLYESEKKRLKSDYLASVDAMTSLYNRRWLDNNILPYLKSAVDTKQPVSILMIDLDHFKNYNDNHGHLAGDRVITVIAQTIMSNLRPMDRVVRYGGEEFLALLPNTTEDEAHKIGNKLCRIIRATAILDANGDPLPGITISIGAATMNSSAKESNTSLIKRADKALYRSKNSGRDQVSSAE